MMVVMVVWVVVQAPSLWKAMHSLSVTHPVRGSGHAGLAQNLAFSWLLASEA